MSKKFAAYAPVSGAFYVQTDQVCNPGQSPTPMLEFHGLDDHIIPYDGGERSDMELPAIPTWFQRWITRDGSTATNVSTEEYGGHVQVSTWTGDDGVPFALGYLIDNLGHDWPCTEANADSKNGTYLNATTIIMEFFSNHTLTSSTTAPSEPSATSTASGTSSGSATSATATQKGVAQRPSMHWCCVYLIVVICAFSVLL